jgi:hypothetical protein
MRDKIKSPTTEYTGFYRGKVVLRDETKTSEGQDLAEPKKWGRIKIRVYPMMASEDIPVDSLPWAVPALPIGSGGSNVDYGSFAVPQIDSMVWVFFEQGNPYYPVYFAEASDGVHGLPSWLETNYPDRRGFTFKNGLTVVVDEKDNTCWLMHPSGTGIKIEGTDDDHGKIIGYGAAGIDLEVEKDADIKSNTGNITITATAGKIELKADAGEINIEGATGVNINP